jgi:hypothetical protein
MDGEVLYSTPHTRKKKPLQALSKKGLHPKNRFENKIIFHSILKYQHKASIQVKMYVEKTTVLWRLQSSVVSQ